MLVYMEKVVRWPTFGKNFSALLERTGVTLYELEERTGLRSSNMSRVKAGTARATDKTITTLAAYKPLQAELGEMMSWRLEDEHPDAAGQMELELDDEGWAMFEFVKGSMGLTEKQAISAIMGVIIAAVAKYPKAGLEGALQEYTSSRPNALKEASKGSITEYLTIVLDPDELEEVKKMAKKEKARRSK